jgi:hypothetical protein
MRKQGKSRRVQMSDEEERGEQTRKREYGRQKRKYKGRGRIEMKRKSDEKKNKEGGGRKLRSEQD